MPNLSGLLSTKLQPARVGTNLVERPRLTDALSGHHDRRLTLVCAPAGYGKSVLLVQYLQECGVPSVWYQLDRFDNDLAMFLEYLVAGIRKHKPTFGADVLEIIAKYRNLSSEERRLVTYLVNDLESFRESGLLVVLDDYHNVSDRSIHEFIEHLVEYLPKGVHIIISTRTRPPMRLTRLKVQGSLLEVGGRELRFSEAEAASLLSVIDSAGASGSDTSRTGAGGSPIPDAVKDLHRHTQGWPAAVQLMGMALKNPDRQSSTAASFKTRKDIYDYLASEVFDRLGEEEKSFLVETSLLNVVTPDLADRLLERPGGSAEVLRSLAERDLFVSLLEGEDEAYRYHDLFREFLKTRLGPRKMSLLRKTGQCLFESGEVERSVEFFLEAKEYDLAVLAMVPAGQKGMRYGRWQTVARWLQRLPEKHHKANGWVRLYKGVLAVYAGRLDEAAVGFCAAQSAFEAVGDEDGVAQTLIRKASILRLRGRYSESLGLIETALGKLDPSTLDLHASTEQASIMYLQGDFEASLRVLKEKLSLAERLGDSYIAGTLLEMLTTVYYMTGEYGKAVEAHQRAVELLPGPLFGNSIGAIYSEWGDLDLALEHAEQCLTALDDMRIAQTRPYGHYQCGIVLMHRGDLDGAMSHFQSAVEISRESGGDKFSEALNLSFLAHALMLQGNYCKALLVAEEAMKIGRDQSPYIVAICQSSLAYVILASGGVDRGLPLLEEAAATFERFGARFGLMKCQAVLATVRLEQGHREEAVRLTSNCLRLAAAEHYVQEFVTSFVLLEPTLCLAMEEGIEPEFVGDVLRRLGPKCLRMLSALSGHKDPKARLRAVAALSSTGQEDAKEILLRLMKDPDQVVSDRALAAIRSAPEAQPRAVNLALASEGALFVTCLGPFRVFAGDQEVEMAWRTTKARDIFAYLLSHAGGPVSKERILEDLWPGLDSGQASTLFHTSLYQLRKALRDVTGWEETILYAGGHYRIARGLASTDVDRLDLLSGSASHSTGDAGSLEKAVALFQGSYFEDLDYPWVAPERGRLDGLFAEAAERLARRLMELGEMGRAAACLRSLLQRNPLLEEVHCLLMTCHASMGDRMAVMQQYETLKDVLDRDLGVDPSSKTRSLYYHLCGERLENDA